MILTCPACATQYAVKDGAIPPGGRQVRCASCKHAWHQDPPEDETMPETAIAPPPPSPGDAEAPLAEAPEREAAEAMIAQEPMQSGAAALTGNEEEARFEDVDEPRSGLPGQTEADRTEEPDGTGQASGLDDYAPPAEALEVPDDKSDGFDAIPDFHDEDRSEGTRKWGLILGLILLVVAAAAAFWFLAPPEYKARAGIAAAGATPLELMLTTSDRQKLASGNELLAISGRIINPTDQEQAVPPIKAELRNKSTRQLVYSWTIAPPARVLPARGSASFNSAEVDIPQGGDELTVTLGAQAG